MTALTIVVGNKNYSSWSLRAWLAVVLTGAEFEEVVIPLYEDGSRERIRQYNPAGLVPVLIDGKTAVWDSLAISEYLAERYPDAGLWPADDLARARARSVVCEMHAGFAALRAHLPMNIRGRFTGREIPDEIQAQIDRIAAIWHDCRSTFGSGGPFLFGAPSLADAAFAPVVTRFDTFAVRVDEASAAYCATIRDWAPMRAWTEAAVAEPWTVDYAEF